MLFGTAHCELLSAGLPAGSTLCCLRKPYAAEEVPAAFAVLEAMAGGQPPDRLPANMIHLESAAGQA